jgi:prolyl 4-hydroxylase
MNARIAIAPDRHAGAGDPIPGCADISLLRAVLAVLDLDRSLAEIAFVAQQFPAEQRSLLELRDMLARLGVSAEGRGLPAAALDAGLPPVIALLSTAEGRRFNLVCADGNGFSLFDGVHGWRSCSVAELAAAWCDVILTLDATPPASAPPATLSWADDRALRSFAHQHVRIIEGAFDPELCAEVVRSAAAGFAPSRVGGEGDAGWRSLHRSSSSSMFGLAHPQLHRALATRAAALVPGLTGSCFELAQCVRYGVGEQYRPHLDVPVSSPRVASGQRTWTVLVYLNDDFEGGETAFPLLDLSVRPRRGTALIFRNRDAQGLANLYTMHAGQPVRRGIKYACNLWAAAAP